MSSPSQASTSGVPPVDDAHPSPTPGTASAPGRWTGGGGQLLLRVVAVVAITVGVGYLTWRALFTINPDARLLSWSLWALEAYAVAGLGLFTFALWDVRAPTPVSRQLPRGETAVLITTYNESLEVIEPVVVGALRIDTPHQTWILDDGARPEIARLARELGASYIARPDNVGAKAGNLNHALASIDVDFIAVLDADQVPHDDLLRNTLPYLNDPDVAFVQTPQTFYNEDSFEHVHSRRRGNRAPTTEQSLFYRVVQPAKNRWNSAFWCGTNAILRTRALAEVGGVAMESVTEDFQTTIRLHRAGWKSIYHDEVLARGLAAPTAEEYLMRRRRWCTGAMQTWHHERPLTDRSLAPAQRLAYGTTLLAWFDPLRTLGLLLLPPVVILTGQAPIVAPVLLFLAVFVVAFALQQVALLLLGRGLHRPIANTVFELVRMEAVLLALTESLVSRKILFRVTPKGRTSDTSHRARTPHLLVAVAVLYAVAFGFYGVGVLGLIPAPAQPGVVHGAALWALFSGVLLVMAIARILSPRFAPERRRSYRHPVVLAAEIEGRAATVVDLSLTGLRVELSRDRATALLETDHVDVDILRSGGVVRLSGAPVGIERIGPNAAMVSLEFTDDHHGAATLLHDVIHHG